MTTGNSGDASELTGDAGATTAPAVPSVGGVEGEGAALVHAMLQQTSVRTRSNRIARLEAEHRVATVTEASMAPLYHRATGFPTHPSAALRAGSDAPAW